MERSCSARRDSSSPSAVAIQVPSCSRSTSVRTVTRPPRPRVTMGSPEGSLWNDTGPRLAATTRRRSPSAPRSMPPPLRWSWPGATGLPAVLGLYLTREQVREEPQVVAQQARREELAPHLLLADQRHAMVLLRVGEHLQAALGTLGDGVHQVAVDAVRDLQRNAADVAADGRS